MQANTRLPAGLCITFKGRKESLVGISLHSQKAEMVAQGVNRFEEFSEFFENDATRISHNKQFISVRKHPTSHKIMIYRYKQSSDSLYKFLDIIVEKLDHGALFYLDHTKEDKVTKQKPKSFQPNIRIVDWELIYE